MISTQEQNQLVTKLAEVIPFKELPDANDLGERRTASENGYVAVEFLPSKATVFVQNKDMEPINLVQHTAILELALQCFFPRWKKRSDWLKTALDSEAPVLSHYRGKEKYTVSMRKTDVGCFLGVEDR